jgi:hypothetical protein
MPNFSLLAYSKAKTRSQAEGDQCQAHMKMSYSLPRKNVRFSISPELSPGNSYDEGRAGISAFISKSGTSLD